MMNILGKGLALTHVALSLVLMTVALAMYFNAVDFGWKQPARYYRDITGKTQKADNLLIPSLRQTRGRHAAIGPRPRRAAVQARH